jgi:diguanylate cyclase (GGDEF)-like protein
VLYISKEKKAMCNDENGLTIDSRIKYLSNLLLVQTVNCTRLQSQLAEKDSALIEKRNKILGLKHLLEHEKITGLFTRYYFDLHADKAVSRTRERRSLDGGRTLAVVMIDLDFFKTVNDTFGHHSGDEVLYVFGDIIRQRLRGKEDIGCRWGGDEFALLLQGVTKEYTEKIVGGLKVALEKADFSFNHGLHKEKQVHPTFSYGIAMQTREKESFPALLQMADRAMYESRKECRKGCCR